MLSSRSSDQLYRRLSALEAVISHSSSDQLYRRNEWVDLLPAIEFFARINLDALTISHTLGGIIVALNLLNSMLQIIKNNKKIKSEHFNIKTIFLT